MGFPAASASLLLLVGMAAGGANGKEQVYVGRILEVSRDGMELDTKNSTVSIGFFGEEKVLDRLGEVDIGDEVRVVFGVGTPPGETRPINKLLLIRRCARNDQECAADRKVQEARDALDDKERAASEERYAICNRAMDNTLLKDPRYVAARNPHRSASNKLLRRLNSFNGEKRICADKIISEHQAAVFDACKLHHCGDNIGGGCSHISGNALSRDAIDRAVQVCKEK